MRIPRTIRYMGVSVNLAITAHAISSTIWNADTEAKTSQKPLRKNTN